MVGDYYPFGLTMAGISSKALAFGEPENKLKYNGIEHNDAFDINMYDAFYRNLDPQIGRFWQIDPETEAQESFSPYESMGNNPILNVDPLGDFKTRFGAWLHKTFTGGGGDIQQNEYGEWYVSKSKIVTSESGEPVAQSWRYYGKGRDQYSTVREAIVRDLDIAMDIRKNGENSMYQMYDSPHEAGMGALSLGTGVLLPNPLIKAGTNAVNATQASSKILSRAERLELFKERLSKASLPKNPKEALKLINKTLDKIEDIHSGASDRMRGILDNKYVTLHPNGNVTALTKGHRIEIMANGSFSIYERSTGALFFTK